MMPQKYTGSLEGMRAFLKDFGPAADKLHDAGMKLHYHNHGFEYEKFDGKCSSTTWRRRPTRQMGLYSGRLLDAVRWALATGTD